MPTTQAPEAPAATTVEAPASQAPEAPAAATVEAPASQAAVEPAKPKKQSAEPSARVASIRAAAEALAGCSRELKLLMEFRPFKSNPHSFVLRLPTFKDAVETLPKNEDAKAALTLLRGLQTTVDTLCGDHKRTWVFHKSGSFALYSKVKE